MNNAEESFVKDGMVSFDQGKVNAVRVYFKWMVRATYFLLSKLFHFALTTITCCCGYCVTLTCHWQPIRQVSMDDNLRIWRTFSIRTLMDLVMVGSRDTL
jgi:alkaline phosphatase D